jgi:acetoin:2,6-dichlorophenolindophenol oxidoreductase subunit beta
MTYRAAIAAAIEDAMVADERVVLMGEDVASEGGVFKTTVGLVERFGPSRVFNTPICENGFLGVALGMAVTGLRPVVEIMFGDFLAMGADALVNEIAKFRFLSGGQFTVPLTIRATGGGSGRFGAQHSATAESWFIQQPGLNVVTSSSPGGAYSALRAAMAGDDPTLVIEHKALLSLSGPVTRTETGGAGPRGASTLRPGSDVTVVATMLMADRCLAAAERVADEGIDVEIIDPTWLRPLDIESIRTSAERTGRLLVVEEQVHAGGWGATVISELAIRGIGLRCPPRTLSIADDILVPYSPTLEDTVLPSIDNIVDAVREIASRGA